MDTTEKIIDIGEVVMQAWKEKGIEATRREVEERLVRDREAWLARYRSEGRKAYAWGFVTRKVMMTPAGDLGPIRIPRLRVGGREMRLIPRYERRIRPLDAMTAEATIGGISQRRMSSWLQRVNGQRLSAATVGRIVQSLAVEVERRRSEPLDREEWAAVAVDGIYGKYRRRGDAVLVVAVGVRWNGSFEVLDWQAGETESAERLERLLNRLYQRGLTHIDLIIGDGAGALQAAKGVVYPNADFQLCLWHLGRILKSRLSLGDQAKFRRDFWEVYNGLDRPEVRRRARRFRKRWSRVTPKSIGLFDERFEHTLGYLKFPAEWRHRVRTVNLAEGFFRNFRRFFNRFPGFHDEAHLTRTMGLYLLGAQPLSWRSWRTRRVAC